MKILFVSTHHGHGACESLWIESAVRLKEEGHDVSVAVAWRDPSPIRMMPLAEIGIRGAHLNLVAVLGRPGRWFRRFLPQGRWMRFAIRRLIRSRQPDVVVFSQANDTSAVPYMAEVMKLGVPFDVVTHGLNAADWPDDRNADEIRRAFCAARRSYWVAERNLEEFQYHIGERLQNAEVVRNPVKLDRDLPFNWPGDESSLRLACVARLQTRPKGHDLLLRAFANRKWRGRDVEIRFFGDGENRRGLERLSKMLGLSDQVFFEGYAENVAAIWHGNHVLLQPSRNEGMPLSLVEALYCGRPALVTDVAGHTELVEDGVNGIVAESASVPAIDRALEKLWNDRHRLREFGEAAHSKIRRDFPEDPIRAFSKQILSEAGLPAAPSSDNHVI